LDPAGATLTAQIEAVIAYLQARIIGRGRITKQECLAVMTISQTSATTSTNADPANLIDGFTSLLLGYASAQHALGWERHLDERA
jgi:hypothetical protein